MEEEQFDLTSDYRERIKELQKKNSKLVEFLKSLEWALYGSCPTCYGHDPSDGRLDYHIEFGHKYDCKLAILIDSPRNPEGVIDACDCYRPGRKPCMGSPLYDGKPYSEGKN